MALAAKPIVVFILALGAEGLAGMGGTDGFEGVLAGGALVLLAGFAPIALFKLAPWGAVGAAIATMPQRTGRGFSRTAAAATGTTGGITGTLVGELRRVHFQNTPGHPRQLEAGGSSGGNPASSSGGATTTVTRGPAQRLTPPPSRPRREMEPPPPTDPLPEQE